MKLYNTSNGILAEHNGTYYQLASKWDDLINREELYNYLVSEISQGSVRDTTSAEELINNFLLPPIQSQEVWAAGVTYLRSRDARMQESSESGGATLYDKVYEAPRPELFYKSSPHRVQGHRQVVYIRQDSTWNVPEPECTLFVNSEGNVQGYTVGNDMSSRSIEGENALYLPQAKIYERSASIGPCLYVPERPLPLSTSISMSIHRKGIEMYADSATLERMKRSFSELVTYLYAGCDFPSGVYLMTGTCLVPGADFTLDENDIVHITIEHIGTLTNTIAFKPTKRNNSGNNLP